MNTGDIVRAAPVIWVVSEGEPLPVQSSNGRQMRGGMLATTFSKLGSKVFWWSSTYAHYEKKYFYSVTTVEEISKNLSLVLLHSLNGYRKNISLRRIAYSKDLGNEFKKESAKYSPPDIIYCSYPLIDLSYEAVRYGQEHNIPVVIDIRDLWPDIFIQPFPKLMQPLAKMGVNLLFRRKVSYVMQNAAAVVGVIDNCLNLAQSYGRARQPQDHVVYLSYDSTSVSKEESIQADSYWREQGLAKDHCIVSYIGSISNRIGDFDTLIETAKRCKDPSVKFVFCGTGEYLEEVRNQTEALPNIILPGYRNRAEIQSLLKLSTFGLLAYRNTEDFIDSLPNKFGEYLSQGLIILSSLKGDSRRILEEERCGVYYSDIDALLSLIQKLNNDSKERETMKKNALDLYYREFNASKVYYKFYKFLESLILDSKEKQGRSIDHE